MRLFNYIQDSFQEYENEHSLVLFTIGCNFKCPRCHNKEFINESKFKIRSVLKKLTPLHTAVVFCGGEPTYSPKSLIDLLFFIKCKNLKTKIFTNGYMPVVVENLCKLKLVDSFSIDYKCLLNFKSILGVSIKDYKQKVEKSIEVVQQYGIDLEIRVPLWKNNKHLKLLHRYLYDKYFNFRIIEQEDSIKT